MTAYQLDASTHRPAGADIVIGGSPLRLFRLTAAGAEVFERIAAGADVEPSTLVDRLLDAGAIHPRAGRTRGPFEAADVTLVVPALATRAADADAVARIVERTADVGAVLIVDDGSDPPLEAVDGARILRLRSNVGPAVARNAGLAAVTTPLVAFVDTDVDVSPGWLGPLLGHFADARVGLVAPRIASAPGTSVLARYEQRHSPLDLGPRPGRIAPGTRIGYVPAAALVARTAALRAIDGFDRALRVGEDVDAVWRLVAAGWRCRYEPAAVVRHAPRPSWQRFVGQRITYGSSAAPLDARHPRAVAPFRGSGWSVAVWGLAVARHGLLALGFGGATAGALAVKLRGVPWRTSLRLAARGHLVAGGQLAAATRRTWWPALVAGAVASRRTRAVAARAAALAVAPALLGGGPVRLLDDVAYSVGVWRGVVLTRRWGAVAPDLNRWPRRGDPSAYDAAAEGAGAPGVPNRATHH